MVLIAGTWWSACLGGRVDGFGRFEAPDSARPLASHSASKDTHRRRQPKHRGPASFEIWRFFELVRY